MHVVVSVRLAESTSNKIMHFSETTVLNDTHGTTYTEARRSERGRDGLAVSGAPARGWEEQAAPIPGCIPELAQARGGRKMCARASVCVWGTTSPLRGNSIPAGRYMYSVHLEEIRSQLDVTRVGAGGSSRKGRRTGEGCGGRSWARRKGRWGAARVPGAGHRPSVRVRGPACSSHGAPLASAATAPLAHLGLGAAFRWAEFGSNFSSPRHRTTVESSCNGLSGSFFL